jgi:hypothetical protein
MLDGLASGCSFGHIVSPKSIAHIPVPVPMSRTFCGFGVIGAKNSWSWSAIHQTWCCISSDSQQLDL